MSRASVPRKILQLRFDDAAQEYLRDLRLNHPEHFMEGTPSATQRAITLASLALVQARRPEVQVFNELLIQYYDEEDNIRQVVPDNMVIIHPDDLGELLSFDLPTQDAKPFWVFEYVSKGSKRMDYVTSFDKYERAVRVPYYLTYHPDTEDLSLFRLTTRRRYSSVKPANGRYPIPDLDMEVAILAGWVRYWYAGELLPLPADLMRALNQAQTRVTELEAEVARLRALLGQSHGNGAGS